MTHFSYLKPLHGVQLIDQSADSHKSDSVRFILPFEQVDFLPTFSNVPIWQLIDQGERYTSKIKLYTHLNGYQLNIDCEGSGTFVFNSQHMQVSWQPGGTSYEHYIQSTAIACWLELQGVPCIHANAMSHNDGAFLFIAPSRTGKSTLTTSLINQGFQMMTDDMAALHQVQHGRYDIYPSWPKIRLWPDSAANLIGTKIDIQINAGNKAEQLNAFHTDLHVIEQKNVHAKFAKQELELDGQKGKIWRETNAPLKAIYFLERADDMQQTCEILPVSASKAMILLLQNSMLADAYINLGLEVQRLQWFAELLSTIRVYKIIYKSGLQHLPQVCEQIKCHSLAL
ncbi:hypothetical protein [Paraglaciecola sp.]|uniref:hypothetical protein n=1 Tax=Paraglaciecola sp. TaxID=1920173 RepID=UPI0030F42952